MKKVVRFSFQSKALKRVHSAHRGFIIAGCAAINDINSSMFLVLSLRKGALNEAEIAFISNYICTLLSIQGTKIHEYMKIALAYKKQLLVSHPVMGKKIECDLSNIETKLKSKDYKWIEILRHKVASHLDVGFAEKELNRIDNSVNLNFYVSERKFETAYDFATEVFYKGTFSDIDGGFDAAARHLLSFVSDISHFHNSLVLEIFNQSGLMADKTDLFISEEHLLPLQSGVLPVLYGDLPPAKEGDSQG